MHPTHLPAAISPAIIGSMIPFSAFSTKNLIMRWITILSVSGLVLVNSGTTLAEEEVQKDDFEIRFEALNKNLDEQMPHDLSAAFEAYDTGARQLLKDFPNRPEVYELMAKIGGFTDGEAGIALAKMIVESEAANAATKEQAKVIINKLQRIGKPMALKFTALDGHEVDIEKLKGKVVLINFWATWLSALSAEVTPFEGNL